MFYRAAKYIPGPDDVAATPPFPSDGDWLLLVGALGSQEWGIFECDEAAASTPGVVELPEPLELLLGSAHWYPPALALARDDVDEEFFEHDVSLEVVLGRYAERLIHHLEAQPTAGYQLLQAIGESDSYFLPGAYHWVLDSKPGSLSQPVRWVSWDYFVYQDPASSFRWP